MLEATGLGKPRGPGTTVPRSRWQVGKANNPHLVLMMMESDCFGRSWKSATLKFPRTPWEAARSLRTQGNTGCEAHTSEGIPKDSLCFFEPLVGNGGGFLLWIHCFWIHCFWTHCFWTHCGEDG